MTPVKGDTIAGLANLISFLEILSTPVAFLMVTYQWILLPNGLEIERFFYSYICLNFTNAGMIVFIKKEFLSH